MKGFILVLLVLLSSTVMAKDFRLLEAEEVSIDAIRVLTYRPDYFEEDKNKFTHGANFNLNLRVCKYLFIENRIHFLGTKSQIRQGGWEYRTGADLGKYLQVFYYHHSQHVMERARDSHKFPLEDFYGVRFYFIKN